MMFINRIIRKPLKLFIPTVRISTLHPRFGNSPCGKNIREYQIRTNLYYINSFKCTKLHNVRLFSKLPTEGIDAVTYENVCDETLDSLCEVFEDIIEKYPSLKTADISFGDGVLTINLDHFGTYVINRQSPNKQIWLSSPTSGPKRYDFVRSRNGWVYRHDNQTLHSLLQKEISAIVNNPVDLSSCSYSGNSE